MTLTIARALSDGARDLAAVAGDMARREAAVLLAHVLNVSVSNLITQPDQCLTPEQAKQLQQLLNLRQRHQPISQLIRRRSFWQHDFLITPDVLDPRPDTELLVELALERRSAKRVLDLGTGSGCILCSVLNGLPEATGLGVDISVPALAIARENAMSLGVADRAEFLQSEWFEKVEGQYDLILSNPPYVTADEYATLSRTVRDWEPEFALTDGADGLEAYRAIALKLKEFLAPGGVAFMEHGWQQAAEVAAIFRDQGFGNLRSFRDLAGKDRVLGVGREFSIR